MSAPIVLITSEESARIAGSAERWGRTAVAVDGVNGTFTVRGRDGEHPRAGGRGSAPVPALWAVVDGDWHRRHQRLRRIGKPAGPDDRDGLLAEVPAGAMNEPAFVAITRQPGSTPEWAAWCVGPQGVAPLEVTVLPDRAGDPIRDLGRGWPVGDLARRVVVVGAGSVGSAVAHMLAGYGVRDLVLVDYDRLLPHNLVRHQESWSDLGRYKVDAVADALQQRWPGTRVATMRESAFAADRMRPVFATASVVVCAADGVAQRRTVGHLARRAGCSAVFACVLRDGAVGEVLRVRPWPGTACLMCLRAALVADGAFDPEPELDAAYGTGDPHRPMTATGPDIALVATFAAKLTVATLLEEAGHYEHVMRDDWALIGLRMDRGAPEPFDLFPGQVFWPPTADPRPDCPTCGNRR